MDRIKERFEYSIFGIPVMKKFVYEYEDKEPLPSQQEAGEKGVCELKSETNFKSPFDFKKLEVQLPIAGIIALLIGGVAYSSFQFIAVQNCPEKSQFDNIQAAFIQGEAKVKEVERALEAAREQNNKLSTENTNIASEKNELSRKLAGLEVDVKSLNESLESAKQRAGDLGEENKILREKKDTLARDLDDTKYKYGTCKNKNMDHEVRSMELLQEIEGLKKELKACK